MKSPICSKGQVLVCKSVKGVHPVDRVFGTLRSVRRVDALLDLMRGPRAKKKR